jgi:hypothetical protein
MPIVKEVTDGPLQQGDILKNVGLFASDIDEDTPRIASDDCLALVISRPCATAHKRHIVCAKAEPFHASDELPSDLSDYEKVKQFLELVRDGDSAPDRFYLGQLDPGTGEGEKRYRAHFDSIHTLKFPESDNARTEFVSENRVGRLTKQFRRSLHTRLFKAFAVEGFDDFKWFTAQDLRWAKDACETKVQEMQTEIREKQATLRGKQAQSSSNKKELKNRKKDIENSKEKLEKFKTHLERYKEEMNRRGLSNQESE